MKVWRFAVCRLKDGIIFQYYHKNNRFIELRIRFEFTNDSYK